MSIVLILICVAALILPFVVQRSDFKRLLLIAAGLEASKCLFILFASFPKSELLSLLFGLFIYLDSLPQIMTRMTAGEFDPISLWSGIGLLSIGVIWNLIPAYFISTLLPDKREVGSITAIKT